MVNILIGLICIVLIIRQYSVDKLFTSTTIWLFCYLLIFSFYPLFAEDIFENSGLIGYFSLVGIFSFSFGLLIAKKIRFKKKINVNLKKRSFIPDYKLAFLIFFIFFIISIFVLISNVGMSRIKMILMGQLASKKIILDNQINSSPFTFSLHVLVPCILSMWVSSRTKFQKFVSLICLFVYVLETILFSFTRIFLISIILVILFYETKDYKKNKQLLIACLGVISLFLLMTFMNFSRSLGIGALLNFKYYLNVDFVFESTDFAACYFWFNKMLNFDVMYLNPITWFKPLFAFIPRSIWMNKPEPMSMQMLKIMSPETANIGSIAGCTILGEGYSIFGVVGIILYCLVWGIVCVKIDDVYKKRLKDGNDNSFFNVVYYLFSTFIVMSAHRGDWSQYMTIVLWFYILPMFIISKLHIKVNKKFVFIRRRNE